MFNRGDQLPPGRAIGAKFVGDDAFWSTSLLFQHPDQQPLCSLGISAGLNDLVENIAVLIHSTPEPAFPPTDPHERLVQMPYIILTWRLPTQARSISGPNFFA